MNTFERDLVGYLEPCLWLSIRDRATRKGDWPSSFKTVAYWVADHGQVVNPLLIVLYFFYSYNTVAQHKRKPTSRHEFNNALQVCICMLWLFEMKMRRSTLDDKTGNIWKPNHVISKTSGPAAQYRSDFACAVLHCTHPAVVVTHRWGKI